MDKQNRFLPISSVRNLRDFGGLKTQEGKTIKSGLCYRSAALESITKRDQRKMVKQYHLSQVIDLRTDREKEEKPDRIPKGVAYHHMPLFGENVPGITREKGASRLDQLKNLPDLQGLYPFLLTDPFARDQLKQIMQMIIHNEEGAILWHCSEGKDRCGTVSALFLMLLGVDRETIMEDYLLTNRANWKKRFFYLFLVLLVTGKPKTAYRVFRVYSVEPDFLQATFDTIDNTFGGTEAFFKDTLGITEEDLAVAKARYLE